MTIFTIRWSPEGFLKTSVLSNILGTALLKLSRISIGCTKIHSSVRELSAVKQSVDERWNCTSSSSSGYTFNRQMAPFLSIQGFNLQFAESLQHHPVQTGGGGKSYLI